MKKYVQRYVLRKNFPRCFIIIFFLTLLLSGCDRFYNNALAELKEGKHDVSLLAQLFLNHDTIPPTVTSIMPEKDASDVALNSGITAIFSEDIDPATISDSSFIVTRDGQQVKGAVKCMRNSVTFKPSSNLDPNANYDITMGTDIKDLAGNNLEEQSTWRFTTGTQVDTEPPVVTMTVPADQTTGIPLNTAIYIVLNESVDPVTVRPDTCVVTNDGIVVTGELICKKNTIIFRPKNGLRANATCTVKITSGVSDIAGNGLAGGYNWSFTLSNTDDNTPPSVVQTQPIGGTMVTDVDMWVKVFFNEPIDTTTVTGASIYLTKDGRPIDGIVEYNNNMIMVRTIPPLENNTMYTVVVMTDIKDLAGNMLKEPCVFSFNTVDDTPPEIPTFSLELSPDIRKINVKDINANRARRFIIEWRPRNASNWSSYDTGIIKTNSHTLYTTDTLEPWKTYQVKVRAFNLNGIAGSYSNVAEITTGSTFQYGTPVLEWTNLKNNGTVYYSDLFLHVDLPEGAVQYSAHVDLNKSFQSNIVGGPTADVTQPIEKNIYSKLIQENVKVYDSIGLWYWKLQQITGTARIIFYNDMGKTYTTGDINISAGTPPGLPNP